MSRLLNPLHQHWQRLPARERRALLALALFVGLVLAWRLIWQPQQHALQHAERRYQEELQLQIDLANLPHNPAPPSERIPPTALPGYLARTSANADITLERMDGDDSGRVNLHLAGTLDSVLAWMERLEDSGVEVVSLGMDVSREADVKVRMVVEAPQEARAGLGDSRRRMPPSSMP
ncbi:type II secretion system protein M [Pseudomonas sp. BN415]|uniref:type II secretion system protein GspM n=1 Tax=Pseudomonas sp. BN415 TaxID=2567889 RepID=UPI0024578B2F|nr:type II secretion system protein GspM [Pseudomonas sp. BN415]MDH4585470.1 type II secretion system protein M [Pseudomonas sp. BN415]